MRMRRSPLFGVVALMLGVLLVNGCAAAATPTPTATPRPIPTPTAAPIPTPTTPPMPTPVVLQPLTVGDIDIFEGGNKVIADAIKAGMQVAFDEINADGGAAGFRLELQTANMGFSTEKAVTEARRMVLDQGIKCVTVGIQRGAAVAVAQLAKEQKTFLLTGGFATTKRLTGEAGSRYSSRANLSTVEISGTMAQYLKNKPEIKSVATISPDYEYGQHLVADFRDQLKQVRPDIEIVREAWPALGTADMTPHVTAIQAEAPDLVFTGIFGGDLVNFLKAAKDFGLLDQTQIFIHGLDLVRMELNKEVLPEGAWGTVWYPFWVIDTPASDAFVDKYQALTGEIPSGSSMVGYYAGRMIGEAIRRTTSADLEAVLDVLDQGFTFEAPTGTITVRGCDHMALGPFYVGVVDKDPSLPGGIGLTDVVSIDTKTIARSCEDIARARGQ